MIRLEGVTVEAGTFALREVSLEVPPGGYALVIGPTGSGKTTLLEAVAGHVAPRQGRVRLHGEDVSDWPPERRGVGFVYQHYHLFPHCTVRENIGYGLRQLRQAPAEQAGRVEELAGMLGIAALLDRGVQRLSGGEQQRVALARALAPRPRILLLDEPFAAVDPSMRQTLRRELRALHEREGTTTLQVTHDFDDALRLGDLVAVLAEGRIVQSGPPDTVFRYPNSPFVARFIGAGTVLAGRVRRTAAHDTPPFEATFTTSDLVLDVVADREGPAHAVIRPEDVLLSREPFPTTPRNRFRATVTRVERTGALAHVHLEAGGAQFVAVITAATATAMAPEAGEQLHAALKATAVHLL